MNVGKGVKIRDIAIHHGSMIRDNEYYYELYGKKAFIAQNIIEDFLVRDKRYVVDKEKGENATTLAIEAAKKVLSKSGLTGKDIDMICFCTFTGESVSPPNAIRIHHEIEGREDVPCFDTNANCIGMVLAFEQLSKYMIASNGIDRVLIIGSECLSLMFNPDEIGSYVAFGDTACAMIIEKTEDMSKIIDTTVYTTSCDYNVAAAPMCGLSNIFEAPKEKLYFTNNGRQADTSKCAEIILHMLDEHNLSIEDISLFCVSQCSKAISSELLDKVGAKEEQRLFVMERFGYTGANSPFLALNEAVETGKVKRGEYVFIWTVGVGTQNIMSLIRY